MADRTDELLQGILDELRLAGERSDKMRTLLGTPSDGDRIIREMAERYAAQHDEAMAQYARNREMDVRNREADEVHKKIQALNLAALERQAKENQKWDASLGLMPAEQRKE